MENEPVPAIWLDVHDLRIPLEEAQETLRAIRLGEVDALVIKPDEDARILTLEKANADLEAQVGERTAALIAANERKDAFLAMLGHELRNPLSALSNALYLLRSRRNDADAARSQELMERQVRRLVRLANDLTDVAQINQGKVTLIISRIDLARLIRHAVEDCQDAVEKAGLAVSLDLPPSPVWVQGDPDRLAQVLSNLLQNAIKFTDPGGRVSIQVSRRSGVEDEPAFDIAGPERPNARTPERLTAVVTLRDTGIGIEPELLPQIFETFRQVEESRDRSPGGLGLGLALAKGLIELHGGSVSVHSEGLGHGAEFTLRLPLAAPAAVQDRGADPA